MTHTHSIPRPEFPNPQFERKNWQNLNGKWQFKFDGAGSGEERNFAADKSVDFDYEINVPFTYECELSGIGIKDFCENVWYRRTFTKNENWNGGRILLHIGAADYYTKVWVNGRYAGFHKGGMTSFSFDISKFVTDGENTVTIKVTDNLLDGKQPAGKQSYKYFSHSCLYTRTTGIWQTVWLEYAPFESFIKNFKLYPDIANSALTINMATSDFVKNSEISTEIFYKGKKVCEKKSATAASNISFTLDIPKENLHLWEIGKGELYDIIFSYGKKDCTNCRDVVYSYFGMRSIATEGEKFLLNGKSVFQRLVLDQGFYPDGTFTAPSEEALKNDILLSIETGFNGARLHQKIFEPLFHYHADKLGYITWGEHGNWGMDYSAESYLNFTEEWFEAIDRDFNHPSIIGWCPHNETHMGQRHDDLAFIYNATKSYDITRLCIDTSGYVHVATDIFDVHDYDQNAETFKSRYDEMLLEGDKKVIFQNHNILKDIEHLPYFVSEFGGTWWSDVSKESENHTQSWGYGKAPEDIESFYARFKGLIDALLDNPRICAFCYTQLTDVEQEQNGVVTYNRKKKFDMKRLNDVMTRKAAIED